ncbi:hypothetical protein SV7mr_38520 [Stieleria bergensis]|uniref:Tetratricopeptide repeat protein n=1 Tax=Stieleria bergensis TaxID=2528025 RepID=A0A517SYU0_9BACT|nr:MAG: hypothetical protein CBB71_10625 [Rhodopirellula sp. TMED11]QDT61317.1 hypothetical protein SV7mr_38520 [Planctomycetes bacterium SV_7m_r]
MSDTERKPTDDLASAPVSGHVAGRDQARQALNNGVAADDGTNDFLQRRQRLERKLSTNPTDLEGFLELAAIYRSEARPLEAKRLLETAQGVFPDNAEVLWELEEAILARSLQQLREVTEVVSRIRSPEALHELQRSQSDWAQRRIEVCQARIKRNPLLHEFRFVMAEAHLDAEQYDQVLETTEPLLKVDSYFPQAKFLRGRCRLAMGDDLAAMRELRAVAFGRQTPAPKALRLATVKLLFETAERLELSASLTHYRELLYRLGSQSGDSTIIQSQNILKNSKLSQEPPLNGSD